MTTPTADLPPNHHHRHPAFRGLAGALAGLTMTIGREGDARVAAELTALDPTDHLVDIGCGPGSAARYAAARGTRVTGVDPAAVMLDLARRLTRRDRVAYVEGAAEALPLGDGEATVMWALATVHHWPDLTGALSEIQRVLAPGGRFVAIERHTPPGAHGHASHGWTDAQAEAFAELCRQSGCTGVAVATHDTRWRRLISVVAHRP
jgi:ubiquinone/menaquinone biosynthesis C-methylase UbiE